MARSIRFNESADAKQFNCFLYLQLLPLHRDPRLLSMPSMPSVPSVPSRPSVPSVRIV